MMDLSAYIGLPFAERGRDRTGLDCWGLLHLVYRERLGLVLPSFSDRYATTEDGASLAGLIAGELGPWREIAAGDEQSGDALLMSLGGLPRHIGVVCGRGRVMHIERGSGSIIEPYTSPRLRRRVLGFYRHERLS